MRGKLPPNRRLPGAADPRKRPARKHLAGGQVDDRGDAVIGDRLQSLFTIGHSSHPLERFLELLYARKLQVVVDVRSAPCSRYAPWFNRRQIEENLKLSGFRYLFMGDLIGGKPTDPNLLDSRGRVDYVKLAAGESFRHGLDRLEKGLAAGWRIALMCAEEDPLKCHRHWLIARELELGRRVRVYHLRADGTELRAMDHFGGGTVQLEMF